MSFILLAMVVVARGKSRPLAVAVVTNICGRFLNREMFGRPMNMVLQYLVPILSVPALVLFKYGKQRGYLQGWLLFHVRPTSTRRWSRTGNWLANNQGLRKKREAAKDGTVSEVVSSATAV